MPDVRETTRLDRFRFQPGVDVFSDLIFCNAIALLDHSLQLVALSVDLVQIIVRKIAPLLFDPSFELFPVSLDAIPIHGLPRALPRAGGPHEFNVTK